MDILVIQNAIEEYSRKYPKRAAPSAEVALAWKFGGRGRKKKQPANLEERVPVRFFGSLLGWWLPHRRT
jgi:hypothetical protein